ncbi:MAG: TadE/TadG family type IV pilus assembly protein [Sphingomonas paucimobilis]
MQLPRGKVRIGRKAFSANVRGSTVVEFALITPVFLMFLLGMFETSIVYFSQQALESAAEETMRSIVVGELRSQAAPRPAAVRDICDRLPAYMRCGRMTMDVTSVPTLADLKPADLRAVRSDAAKSASRYDTGGLGDIVALRLYYEWPATLPLTNPDGRSPDGTSLLVATRIGKAEGYRR